MTGEYAKLAEMQPGLATLETDPGICAVPHDGPSPGELRRAEPVELAGWRCASWHPLPLPQRQR
jgi:hypothetical protein